MKAAVIALLLLGVLGWSFILAGGKKVNKHKPWIEASYHGVIMENTDIVLLDPPLVALDKDSPVPYAGEICEFKIYGDKNLFEAKVLNSTSGEGVLRARSLIDCEQQKEFRFIIQAYDCGADHSGAGRKKSHKAVVHIQVDDVNEFPPVFREPAYQATVTEKKIYDSIVQVEAWDQDCSAQYSQICNYEIVTRSTPFAIDRNGNIRNTESLCYSKQQNYEILVSAYDCGQKRVKESVPVHIHVQPMCKPGWQGWNKQVDYEPGTGSKQLFSMMQLEMCDSPLSSVRVSLELQSNYMGKGCERETYSEKSLQKLCDVVSGSVNLLPAPSSSTNWTASLVMDSGPDRGLIFHFDGQQAANIPQWAVSQNLTEHFTIATWMKHGPSPAARAEKETLLCNSDRIEMNRHHYSLYVHNCRLVFLLRSDFMQMGTFRPAEFHWKLEQICDKEWHYYVINVEFPSVTLFVDGLIYEPYLVTNDWPIHPSPTDVQVTVGACWQGGEVMPPRFTQYFRGSLSGLIIHAGKLEAQKLISCLQVCKEGLDIASLQSLGKGIKFHFNPAQSVLVMEGDGVENMNSAMSKVSYFNLMQFPTPGLRTVHISTTVQCFGEDSCVSIPDTKVTVMVLDLGKPRFSIAGAQRITIPATELQNPTGVPLFKQIRISSTINQSMRPNTLEDVYNLDYCDVLVIGEELDPKQESLQIQHSSLQGKHLAATNSTSGISIYGVDSMVNYEQAIRQVRYRNWHPSSLSERKFRLSCSELNGRYTSNVFNLEIGILHSAEAVEHVNHMSAESHYVRPMHHALVDYSSVDHISGTPPAATAVIVICIAALVVIVVLGIYRIHTTHPDESNEEEDRWKEPEMEDSIVSITVNPMENIDEPQSVKHLREDECEVCEEDEDLSSSDSEYSEEEEQIEDLQEDRVKGILHWDPSSLSY